MQAAYDCVRHLSPQKRCSRMWLLLDAASTGWPGVRRVLDRPDISAVFGLGMEFASHKNLSLGSETQGQGCWIYVSILTENDIGRVGTTQLSKQGWHPQPIALLAWIRRIQLSGRH